MPTTKNFGPKQRAEALRLLWQCNSYETIAERFGVKRDTIYRLAKRHGADGLADGKKVRNPMLGCRISQEELEGFELLMKTHNYRSKSDLLRALIRKASGMLEVSPDDAQALRDINRALGRIGANMNQIARAANRGRYDRRSITLSAAQHEDLKAANRAAFEAARTVRRYETEARRLNVRAWRASEYGPQKPSESP